MKKIMAVLLVLLLTVTMFAGCGAKNESEKEDDTSSASSTTKKKKKPTASKDSETDAETDEEYETEEEYEEYDDYEWDEEYEEEVIEEALKLDLTTTPDYYAASMYINVKKFGAVGDGKTDDSAAIQKALNSSTSHTVYFPAGTYLIKKTIQISSDTNMLGESVSDGVGGKTVIKAGADLDSLFSGEQFMSMRMWLGNFTFDGSASDGVKVGWGINMYDCRSSTVFNCLFRNISGGGINLDSNGQGSLWVNHFNYLKFENINDYAISAIVSDSFFSHITIDGGKGILDWNYSGNCYSNIIVRGSTGNGISLGREDKKEVGNVTLRDCSLINNARYGVFVGSIPSSPYGKQATISGCYFSGNGVADISTENGYMITVSDCSLNSAQPILATGSKGCAFVNNSVKAASFTNADPQLYLSGNKFSTAEGGNSGYLSDKNTLFPYYDSVFRILGGSPDYTYVNINDCGFPEEDDWYKIMKIAVARVAATGGVIYCPNDSYGLSDTIVIPSNVVIVGGSFYPIGTVDSMFVVRDASRSGFINCNISNPTTTNKTTYGGVYFMRSSDCYMYKCTLAADNTAAMPYAVNIDTDSKRIQIDNCKLGAAAAGYAVVLCRGSDCVFQNLYATAGPSFILKNGSNNILQSNHFETCTTTHITIKGESVKGHIIRSNYFDVNDCCVRMSLPEQYNCGVQINCNTFRTDAREQDESTGLNPPELILTNVSGIRVFGNTFQQGFGILTTGIAATDSQFIANLRGRAENSLFSSNTKPLGSGCTVEGNISSS